MNPKYPVYIISKGRWESRLTAKALLKMKVPFHIVIEPQEYKQYASVIDPKCILVLPFSNLGQGSIPARNWVWEHSITEAKSERHWILDDNIRAFHRFHQNYLYKVKSGTGFRVIEDWVDRYANVPMAGMQYFMFIARKSKSPPLILNTRVYSCILLSNTIPHRWRGRYNEDTDLSLRILKDGFCTMLCKAFVADKIATMTMKGGNTEDLYKIQDGRLKMAKSLQMQHPDVTTIKWKWNRWQHVVDYRPFKHNKLILKPGVKPPTGVNEYGLVLKRQ